MHGGEPPPGPPWLESIRCSFCGKRGSEVEKIIAGPTPAVAICNGCVDLCREIMREGGDPPGRFPDPAA